NRSSSPASKLVHNPRTPPSPQSSGHRARAAAAALCVSLLVVRKWRGAVRPDERVGEEVVLPPDQLRRPVPGILAEASAALAGDRQQVVVADEDPQVRAS